MHAQTQRHKCTHMRMQIHAHNHTHRIQLSGIWMENNGSARLIAGKSWYSATRKSHLHGRLHLREWIDSYSQGNEFLLKSLILNLCRSPDEQRATEKSHPKTETPTAPTSEAFRPLVPPTHLLRSEEPHTQPQPRG